MSVEVVVMGGLTIEVEYEWNGYDNRDCGGSNGCVEDWWIVGIAGRSLKKKECPGWILKRLSAADEEKIVEMCEEDYRGW